MTLVLCASEHNTGPGRPGWVHRAGGPDSRRGQYSQLASGLQHAPWIKTNCHEMLISYYI